MNRRLSGLGLVVTLAACALVLASCGKGTADQAASASNAPSASANREYTVAWTIYAGWMPWPYAQQAGIVKKWADKYGVKIKVVQVNDYVESLNQFSAGKVDAVTSTTMDALTVPAAGGRDSTVLMIGDYSNGNDGVILKGSDRLADIKGRQVNLVENSVSHYLLARALDQAGLKLPDVKTINTSDADIVAAFDTPAQTTALVTWNPQLSVIKNEAGAHEVFDSSKIPGEDSRHPDRRYRPVESQSQPRQGPHWNLVRDALDHEPRRRPGPGRARGYMAKLVRDRPGERYDAQLKTTHLYADPKDAAAYASDPALVAATDRVRQFSFAQGLFGQAARSVDDIGIAFPGGKILGSPSNVKLRFDTTYMAMAADGKL